MAPRRSFMQVLSCMPLAKSVSQGTISPVSSAMGMKSNGWMGRIGVSQRSDLEADHATGAQI
jgi:hypothetical protein